jgi:hypothetical protein
LAIPDSTLLQYYEQWDGYNPADPSTDQGGVELNVLNDWRQQGFAGRTLDAYVAIDLAARQTGNAVRANLIQSAIYLFGGAYIGVELPVTAQTQDVWDVTSEDDPNAAPGSWGGHAVYLAGYDLPVTTAGVTTPALHAPPLLNQEGSSGAANPGTLTCITWGQPKKMTLAWFEKYCSEAYALVSKDWLNASGVSPSGFDLAALENDLALVTA